MDEYDKCSGVVKELNGSRSYWMNNKQAEESHVNEKDTMEISMSSLTQPEL